MKSTQTKFDLKFLTQEFDRQLEGNKYANELRSKIKMNFNGDRIGNNCRLHNSEKSI